MALCLRSSANRLFMPLATISLGLSALCSSSCESPLCRTDCNPLSSASQMCFPGFTVCPFPSLVVAFALPKSDGFLGSHVCLSLSLLCSGFAFWKVPPHRGPLRSCFPSLRGKLETPLPSSGVLQPPCYCWARGDPGPRPDPFKTVRAFGRRATWVTQRKVGLKGWESLTPQIGDDRPL